MSVLSEVEPNNHNELILHSELERWWSIPPNIGNVSEYILDKVEHHSKLGREICIENPETEEKLRYSEISEISGRIASKFLKLGLISGDMVICGTHDPVKFHVFMLGIWRADGVVRLTYPEELGDSLVRCLKESKARYLACDAENAGECLKAIRAISEWKIVLIIFSDDHPVIPSFLQESYEDENCIIFAEDFFNNEEVEGYHLVDTKRSLDSVALILPTSGTTGDSKGAIYTHRILLDNILAHEHMPFTDLPRKPTIITSRQTHYCGSIVGLSFFTAGRYLLTMRNTSVIKLLEAVDKYKVRAIVAFPTYLTGMVNHPELGKFNLSSIHFLSAAGQVVGPEAMAVIKKLPNLREFINLYGMTEAGLLATSADWQAMKQGVPKALEAYQPFSVGKLAPSSSLKILDVDTGAHLGPNMKGELCFKTSVTTCGYLSRPEEEAQTFTKNGWISTGDVGYYDKQGFIFVVDRAKEIFKWNSNHVSPSEIENILLRHPHVTQAVVVPVPDKQTGFVARGFIEVKNCQEKMNTNILKEEVIQLTKEFLPPYKQLLGGLFILNEVPVGKTGKVIRRALSQLDPPKVSQHP